jgi:hypothetical protein
MQAAGAAPTAGSDTQVIFNQAGTLVGHNNFTFVPSTNTLSVPTIELGNSILTGTQRVIIARTNDAYADIIIEPKGAGSVHAYLTTGALIIGSNTSSSTYQRLQARGAGAQVDIALEPKGTDGMVFIGDKDEAGAFRKLAARGYNADLHLMLQSKGQGNVILDPDPNNSLDGAWVKIGQGSGTIPGTRTRRLYADSEYATTNLEIGGGGNQNFVLLIGTSNQNVSTRLLTVGSSATDCNLNIYGKGAGLVAVNGIVRSKKIAFYWNMDNTGGITIAHGFDVNSWKKIVSVDVVVRNNFDAEYGPLDRKVGADTTGASQGGIVSWGNTTVALTRRDGGFFDNANYNLFSPYVRGWIYINYEL